MEGSTNTASKFFAPLAWSLLVIRMLLASVVKALWQAVDVCWLAPDTEKKIFKSCFLAQDTFGLKETESQIGSESMPKEDKRYDI